MLYKLEKEGEVLTSQVIQDEYTAKVIKAFDWDFKGENQFTCWHIPENYLPENYGIGLIVGSSGSGKSTLLKQFGTPINIEWDNTKAIVSNFSTPDEAINKLTAVGLNSIPSWTKPFNVLSNGEQFRANLARQLISKSVIDEFTSVVDRNVAKACATSISKYIKKNNLQQLIFASCHRDIIEWLEPDWIFDTDNGELLVGSCTSRPRIEINIYETTRASWELFKKHHYLSNEMNNACRCYLGVWNNQLVAFSGNLCLPGKIPPLYEGDTRGKFRESRLVVLPDYQGMGIGTRFSNAIGEIFLNNNYRYFSKTAHVRMGEYRQKSILWRATSTNLKSREKSQKHSKKEKYKHIMLDTKRLCYSHEYIGELDNKYRILYEEELKKKELRKCLKNKKS